jgi:hypothetical protein
MRRLVMAAGGAAVFAAAATISVIGQAGPLPLVITASAWRTTSCNTRSRWTTR